MYKAFFEYIVQILLQPFKLWMKVKVSPADPRKNIEFKSNVPFLYVLPTQSKTDLFVLRWQARLCGLPVPSFTANAVKSKKKSGYLYLSKLGLFLRRRAKNAPAPLYDLLKMARDDSGFELQIVPVTIIWGRNPGKQDSSVWKLIFSDDENAGFLRKFFILLVQGRSVFMHVGKPISLQEQAKSESDIDQTAKKIRRVIRVHFHKQRVATLGPSLYDRSFVANSLIRSKSIQDYIAAEEEKKKGSTRKVEDKVRKYVAEMAAEPKPNVIRGYEVLLRYVWSKIFNGVNIYNNEDIRELHATHEVVYMTCHRSHVDYLLLGYVLYELGVFSPHTAAGNNLNFWPAGKFLRAGGAFFIRRSVRGNRLYSLVFSEYMHFLLSKGYTINFFPEGGRSRTGRTLPAKTGMVSMIVHSCLRETSKPIALVPVYVGYDSVIEIMSYLKELRGSKKKKESFQQLFGLFKIFRKKYGKAYVNFGSPIDLANYLQSDLGLWDGQKIQYSDKPEWFSSGVNKIAGEVMSRINGAAVLSPSSLAALAILATPQKAISESDFRRFFATSFKLIDVLKKYYPSIQISSDNLEEVLDKALNDPSIHRFKYPGDDVLHLSEIEAIKMSYYRNNIVHVFVGIAMVANQFIHNDRLSRKSVLLAAMKIYPFVDKEYYIGLSPSAFSQLIADLIEGFVEQGLLMSNGEGLVRPDVTTDEFATLRHFGNSLRGAFERYGIASAFLHQRIGEVVDFSGFEEQCAQLSDRIALLNGQMDPSQFDRVKLRGFAETARGLGYISVNEQDQTVADESLNELFECLSQYLSEDIISSVKRTEMLDEDPHA